MWPAEPFSSLGRISILIFVSRALDSGDLRSTHERILQKERKMVIIP